MEKSISFVNQFGQLVPGPELYEIFGNVEMAHFHRGISVGTEHGIITFNGLVKLLTINHERYAQKPLTFLGLYYEKLKIWVSFTDPLEIEMIMNNCLTMIDFIRWNKNL